MPHSAEPTRNSDDRRLQHDLAAEQVAEFAVQRHDDGRAEQVGGDDPRQVVEAAEFADDGRQRGRDDGLIERGEQHDQQQCRKQQADRRVIIGLSGRTAIWLRIWQRWSGGLSRCRLVHGATVLKLINSEINICDIVSLVKLNAMARIPSDDREVKRQPRSTAAVKARKLSKPAQPLRAMLRTLQLPHRRRTPHGDRAGLRARRAARSSAPACSTRRSPCSRARASSTPRSARLPARRVSRRRWCITTSRRAISCSTY